MEWPAHQLAQPADDPTTRSNETGTTERASAKVPLLADAPAMGVSSLGDGAGGEFGMTDGWHALLYWNYALWGGVAVSAAYGVLFVGAVTGNVAILVLYAMGRKPSAFPRVNVLVLHMAATDLLVALAVIPMNLCAELFFGALPAPHSTARTLHSLRVSRTDTSTRKVRVPQMARLQAGD